VTTLREQLMKCTDQELEMLFACADEFEEDARDSFHSATDSDDDGLEGEFAFLEKLRKLIDRVREGWDYTPRGEEI